MNLNEARNFYSTHSFFKCTLLSLRKSCISALGHLYLFLPITFNKFKLLKTSYEFLNKIIYMKKNVLKWKILYILPIFYLCLIWLYIFQNSQLPSRDEGTVISINKVWMDKFLIPLTSVKGSLLLPFFPLFGTLKIFRLMQFLFLLMTVFLIYTINVDKKRKIYLASIFVVSLLSLPWLCESNFYPFFVVILFSLLLHASKRFDKKIYFVLGLTLGFAIYFKFLFLFLLVGILLLVLVEARKYFPYFLLGLFTGMVPFLIHIYYEGKIFFLFFLLFKQYFTTAAQYDGFQSLNPKLIFESVTLSFFRDFHQYFPTGLTFKDPIYSNITKILYYLYIALLLTLPFFIQKQYLKKAICLFYLPYLLWLFVNPISTKNVHMTLFFTLFLLLSISYCKEKFLLIFFIFTFFLLIHQQWVLKHLFDEKYFTIFSSYRKTVSQFLLNESFKNNFIILSPSNDYLFEGLDNLRSIRLWDFEDIHTTSVNLTFIKEKALKRLQNVVQENKNIVVIMPTDESRQCKIYGDCCPRDIRICFFIKPIIKNFFGNKLKLVKTINDSAGNMVIKIYEVTT